MSSPALSTTISFRFTSPVSFPRNYQSNSDLRKKQALESTACNALALQDKYLYVLGLMAPVVPAGYEQQQSIESFSIHGPSTYLPRHLDLATPILFSIPPPATSFFVSRTTTRPALPSVRLDRDIQGKP